MGDGIILNLMKTKAGECPLTPGQRRRRNCVCSNVPDDNAERDHLRSTL